jgi:BlaI family penicillinase repressor
VKTKLQKTHRLGDLQLKILKVLWDKGEAGVGDVLGGLNGDSDLAYTTVATMLRKMEGRGLVSHRSEGRSFIYRARVASKDVSRSMTNHLVERLFEGSLVDAVNHLLTAREVSRDELAALERLIVEKKKRAS